MKKSVKIKKLLTFLFIPLFINLIYSQTDVKTQQELLKSHVRFLASDELEGRYPGTEGIAKAANYIEEQFRLIGVEPINGSYRQSFPVTIGYDINENNKVSFEVVVPKIGVPPEKLKPMTRSWQVTTDWMPAHFSDDGTISGEMVFVGYGITAKDLNYDDYEGIDVKDKIVILLTDTPDGDDPNSKFAPYGKLRSKLINARERGAIGMIIVKINSDSANVFEPLIYEPAARNSGMIAIQANRTSIAKFFPRESNLLPTELEINKTKKPKSFPIPNAKVFITVELVNKNVMTDNIVGLIRGRNSGPTNHHFVIGAHYDHLGWGGPTSLHIERKNVYGGKIKEIHRGADDNASGVAGLIELARTFKENPTNRDILLISFSAEELGLKGSKFYVDNPLLPLEKLDFMINMDMIGRLRDNNLNVFGAGTSPIFNNLLDSLSIVDSIRITRSQGGFGPSDHSSFYNKNIPVLMFITGVHEDYHKPSDTWDKINYRGMVHVLRFIESMIRNIDGVPTKLPFVQADDVAEATQRQHSGYANAPWFGIIPNFEDSPLGCKISGTSPGSPAHKAGLSENDIIIKFGDMTIKNLHDLTYSLRQHKVGDKVLVKYIKATDNKEYTVEVQLSERK